MRGQSRKQRNRILRNKIILRAEEKLKTWEEYIEKLFSDNRTTPIANETDYECPAITKSEVSMQ